MMNGMGGMMGGGMWFGWLFWLVLIGLIIWGVKAMIESQRNQSPPAPKKEEDALEILKKRYARSEIDREEYEEKRRKLME